MHDPWRIDDVLHAIAEAWELKPELYLGQLLLNALRPSTDCRDLLGLGNDELIQRLNCESERMRREGDVSPDGSFVADGLFEKVYGATPAEWKEYWKRRQSLIRGDNLDDWRAWWLRCLYGNSRYLRFRAYEWLWSDLTWHFDGERLIPDDFLQENAVLELLRQETDFRREAYLARIGMRDQTAVEEIRREIEIAPDKAQRFARLLEVEGYLSRGEHPCLYPQVSAGRLALEVMPRTNACRR